MKKKIVAVWTRVLLVGIMSGWVQDTLEVGLTGLLIDLILVVMATATARITGVSRTDLNFLTQINEPTNKPIHKNDNAGGVGLVKIMK